MRRLVVLAILLVLVQSVAADSLSYSVLLQYDSGNFSLKSVDLVGVASPVETTEGEYSVSVISFKEAKLYETYFNVNLNKFFSLPISKGTMQSSSSTKASVNLLLPYYPNAKSIIVFKGSEAILTIDVSRFSICNENSLCDGGESVELCPGDCTCGNGVCEEDYQSCSKDCPAKSSQQGRMPYIALLGFGIVAVLAVVFLKFGKGSVGRNSIRKVR